MLICDCAGLIDAQWDSRSYIFRPGAEKIFLKNYISLTWHSINSLFSYYPPPLPRGKRWPFISGNRFESPLHKDTQCQVWLKLAKWFLSRRFLKVVIVFSLCGHYLPLKNSMVLNLNKFQFLLPKNSLCHVWLSYFQFEAIIYHKKEGKVLHLKVTKFLNPRMFCVNLVEIGPVVLENKSSIYFQYVLLLSPFDKGHGPSLNKLESSSPRNALWQVYLKLTRWFWGS